MYVIGRKEKGELNECSAGLLGQYVVLRNSQVSDQRQRRTRNASRKLKRRTEKSTEDCEVLRDREVESKKYLSSQRLTAAFMNVFPFPSSCLRKSILLSPSTPVILLACVLETTTDTAAKSSLPEPRSCVDCLWWQALLGVTCRFWGWRHWRAHCDRPRILESSIFSW
jgi:hypothetical protein